MTYPRHWHMHEIFGADLGTGINLMSLLWLSLNRGIFGCSFISFLLPQRYGLWICNWRSSQQVRKYYISRIIDAIFMFQWQCGYCHIVMPHQPLLFINTICSAFTRPSSDVSYVVICFTLSEETGGHTEAAYGMSHIWAVHVLC